VFGEIEDAIVFVDDDRGIQDEYLLFKIFCFYHSRLCQPTKKSRRHVPYIVAFNLVWESNFATSILLIN
jgi:hypothetical protein